MSEPSEADVLERAKALWERDGYTDQVDFRSGISGEKIGRQPAFLTPARRQEYIAQARAELRN
jgi:hypothetical protein